MALLLAGLVALHMCGGVLGERGTQEDQPPQPEEVVREFYSYLLSAEAPEKGPALFREPSLFLTGRITQGSASADTAQLWAWLRARRAALGFWSLTSADEFRNLLGGVISVFGAHRSNRPV